MKTLVQRAAIVQAQASPQHADLGPPDIALSRQSGRLDGLIDSAISIVRDETAAIKRGGSHDLEKCAERKGQVLFKLDRILDTPSLPRTDQLTIDRLRVLRKVLDENHAVLRAHIDAVSEVAQIMVRSIERAASDGTYAKPGPAYGQF